MKKILVLAVLLLLPLAFGLDATSKSKGARTIDWSSTHTKKKVRLNFTVHKIKQVKCKTCHYKHKDGKRYWKGCGKSGCHNQPADAQKIGHKTCRDCHYQKKVKTACADCHKA